MCVVLSVLAEHTVQPICNSITMILTLCGLEDYALKGFHLEVVNLYTNSWLNGYHVYNVHVLNKVIMLT